DIFDIFAQEYIDQNGPFALVAFDSHKPDSNSETEEITATIRHRGEEVQFTARGNGPISAFVDGMRETFGLEFRLADFGQNTRSATSKAEAAAYVELHVPDENGRSVFGAGIDTSITKAPIKAVVSALNRI
ncbi:MAG: alpha-isopropylmalate synthase regulatory domain-containing protein, partial [Candidatus Puniceispirillales bacterium]